MEPDRKTAEQALKEAYQSNPGVWVDHSRYVALACENIARRCADMDSEKAYILGLLHDIGRYPGVTSERHLIDGYRCCMERGWEKAAQICISHAFMIQDIRTSIGKFDVSEEDYQFMEQFVDVTIRYGVHPATIDRWKKILEIKEYFQGKMGCSIYEVLPGVVENSMK